jgi:hypothetical protein
LRQTGTKSEVILAPAEDVIGATNDKRSANLVKTEGRQRGHSGGEAPAESNVLQFPRDWIGPREELVPFGTAADAAWGNGVHPDATVEAEPELPPGADDFWGEGSAAVQAALHAPRPVHPAGEPFPGPQSRPPWQRRWHWHRPTGRALTLAIGIGIGIGIIACATVVLTNISTNHVADLNRLPALAPRPAHVPGSAVTTPHAAASARTGHPAKHHAAKAQARGGVAARPRPAHSDTRSVTVKKAAPRSTSGSTHAVTRSTPTESTTPAAPAQSADSSVGSGASAGSSASPSSASGSSAQPSSASGSGGTNHTAPAAGPVGPGAPLGPGQLG